jgi:TolB protein
MWYLDLNHPVPIQLIGGVAITSVKWSPTPITLPRRTYSNPVYKVRFQYPMNWKEVSSERYEGVDGFFQVSAISAGLNIDEVCQNEAFHPLNPYGAQPRISETRIQNQEACFISPRVISHQK